MGQDQSTSTSSPQNDTKSTLLVDKVNHNFRQSELSINTTTSSNDPRYGEIDLVDLGYGTNIFKKRLKFNTAKMFNNVRKSSFFV